MKYTRYDLKKRKKNNAVLGVMLFSTLIFAFIIGTIIFTMFFKDVSINDGIQNTNSNQVEVINSNGEKKIVKYVLIQHGIFSKTENIEQGKDKLTSFGNPFLIQDEKGTRVLLGIFNEEEGMAITKILSDNSIENSKGVFEINYENDPCNEEIAAIITNELNILYKLSDKNVKSIKVEDFKRWSSELKDVKKDSENILILNDLKAHINSLPNELVKENVPNCYEFIYKVLQKLNKK